MATPAALPQTPLVTPPPVTTKAIRFVGQRIPLATPPIVTTMAIPFGGQPILLETVPIATITATPSALAQTPLAIPPIVTTMAIQRVAAQIVLATQPAGKRSNNAFKPKPLRYANHTAGRACHVVRFTTRFGLT